MQILDTSTTWPEKLLAFAMVVSVWTSVRIGSVVGISEITLLILGLFSYANHEKSDDPRYSKYQDLFVKNVLAIIPLGLAWNLLVVNNKAELLHDLFAFIFVFFLVTRVFDKARIFEHLPGITLCFLVLTLLANIGYMGLYATGRGMYMEERFEGLSLDPNQLAEAEFLVPWVSIYLINIIRNKKVKARIALYSVCAASFVSSVYIGYLTDSDSWKLAMMVSVVVYAFLECWRQLRSQQGSNIILILTVIAIVLLVYNGDYVIDRLSTLYNETASDANQLNLRQRLWINGLKAFIQSPVFGNGPGAHSGTWRPFGGAEPHNTFIYILMDFGLIGFLSLLAIMQQCWKMIRTHVPASIIAAYVSFLIFCLFHSFHRMPLFWFYIYYFISTRIYTEQSDDVRACRGVMANADAVHP